MIIPLHLIPADLQQNAPVYFDLREEAPRYTLGGAAVDPALRPQSAVELGLPIAGPVDMADLQRFQALMADRGIALQSIRMLYDRLYALERLALVSALDRGLVPCQREYCAARVVRAPVQWLPASRRVDRSDPLTQPDPHAEALVREGFVVSGTHKAVSQSQRRRPRRCMRPRQAT